MPEISATNAARNFADLLDSVEHDGNRYTIVRRGRPVANLEPIGRGHGAEIKKLLRSHPTDAAWPEDLVEIRALVQIEDRE